MSGRTNTRRNAPQRLTAARRQRFLEVLERTGNRRAAAETIGVQESMPKAWAKKDAGFAADCEAALAAAERRLARRRDPFDGVEDGRFEVIHRSRAGRLQIRAVRPGRWTTEIEDRFIDALRACGNFAASARLVGFSESAVWLRRRQWPRFARRIEQALDEAEVRLEFRLACLGNNVGASIDEDGSAARCEPDGAGQGVAPPPDSDTAAAEPSGPVEGAPGSPVPGPSLEGRGGNSAGEFDPEFALRFLKWREEKRRGGLRRGAAGPPPLPPIEAVTERIVRKVEAIKRHRGRRGRCDSGDRRDAGTGPR